MRQGMAMLRSLQFVGPDRTVKERFLERSNLKGLVPLMEFSYEWSSQCSSGSFPCETSRSTVCALLHTWAEFGALPHLRGCARSLFETLESVYCFFSISLVNHQTFTDMQTVLGLVEKWNELVQLSKTRWACQLRSVISVIVNLTGRDCNICRSWANVKKIFWCLHACGVQEHTLHYRGAP